MLQVQPVREGLVSSVAQACECTQNIYYAYPSLSYQYHKYSCVYINTLYYSCYDNNIIIMYGGGSHE